METAQYYALALKLSTVSGETVQQWITSQALNSDVLEGPLLDLTYLGPNDINEMIDGLEKLASIDDIFEVLRSVLRDVPDSLIANKSWCRGLARVLFQVYIDSDYSVPDDFSLISWFDDEYELASQGVLLSNTDDWHVSFSVFLRSFSLVEK